MVRVRLRQWSRVAAGPEDWSEVFAGPIDVTLAAGAIRAARLVRAGRPPCAAKAFRGTRPGRQR